MRVEVRTPEMSESVSEGTLLVWHHKPGDSVSRDEVLVDLETDKVILEISAPASGELTQLLQPDGAVVKAGEIIAWIETAAAATDDVAEPATITMPAPSTAQSCQTAAEPVSSVTAMPAAVAASTDPLALAAATVPPPEPSSHEPAASTGDVAPGGRRQPMSRLRQRIAERLLAAQHQAALLTTFNEINMAPVKALRQRYQDAFQREHGIKLGFMSFFVKAVVQALRQYPVIHAAIDGTDIVWHDDAHIGVAVSTSRGLVVPVLRHADQMDFATIERQIADFAARAEKLELALAELAGGTFTISNGGVFGSMLSTPIVNPPQSAILGMHAILERPVAEQGQVVIRPMMYVALSYDHRLIDGRDAVAFLKAVKDSLEEPERLLLGV